MKLIKKINIPILILSILLLLCDVISKIIINNNMEYMESNAIINNFFNITKVYNNGASWNILSGYRIILILIGLLMLVILFYYQNNFKLNIRNKIAFSLTYTGIIGNLIDRIYYGYVIDFLDFNIFGYDYPIFNFADIFICIGVILLVIAIIKEEDKDGISSK